MSNIGIDIDETLSLTDKAIIKYYQQKINPNTKKNPIHDLKTNKEIEEQIKLFHKIVLEEDIDFIDPIDHSKEIIKKLDYNNKLYLITARDISLNEPTKKWVEKHFKDVFFEDIRHLEYKGYLEVLKDKNEICKELKIDVLIDDNLKNAIKCANQGIPVILFDLNGNYKWNKTKEELPKNIFRAHDWKEVYKILNKKFNIY